MLGAHGALRYGGLDLHHRDLSIETGFGRFIVRNLLGPKRFRNATCTVTPAAKLRAHTYIAIPYVPVKPEALMGANYQKLWLARTTRFHVGVTEVVARKAGRISLHISWGLTLIPAPNLSRRRRRRKQYKSAFHDARNRVIYE